MPTPKPAAAQPAVKPATAPVTAAPAATSTAVETAAVETAAAADEMSEEEKAEIVAEFEKMKAQRAKALERSREYMKKPETVAARVAYAEKAKAKRERLKAAFAKLGLDLTK